MFRYLLEHRLFRLLHRAAGRRVLTPLAGVLAFALTLSFTVPVTAMLVPAFLVHPRIWRRVAVAGAVGSTAAACVLMLVFHHLGWEQVQVWFPGMSSSANWKAVAQWLNEWGLWGLMAVAALPLPQTPALVFFALVRPSLATVAMGILVGKLIKYLVVGRVVSLAPHRFAQLLQRLEAARNGFQIKNGVKSTSSGHS